MSGYSVDWKHKAPQTIINEEPVAKHHVFVPIATKAIIKPSIPDVKVASPILKTVIRVSFKKTHPTSITTLAKESVLTTTASYQSPKGQPHFYTGDEQEDDHARKSLVYGILSLGGPAAGLLIMLGIALSIGTTLATAPGYALAIFLVFCAAGLVFAVLAIINGFTGINEINADPDTYSGKGEAITGMVLAAIALLGFVGYILVRLLS